MKNLLPEEAAARQAEMTTLKRVWRKLLAEQQAMTAEQRAAQRMALEQKGIVGMGGYRRELVAAKDREVAPPMDGMDVRFRLRDAGVQDQHLEGLKQGLDERSAFTVCRRWWTQPRVARGTVDVVSEDGVLEQHPRLVRQHPLLVLAGPSGLGKTQGAAWCLREAVRAFPWENGRTITNIHLRPFILWHGADLAASTLYGNHAAARMDHADDAWEEAERAVVLVLDDLFPQRKPLSGPHQDRLTRLLTARHGAGRATILTVNMAPPALADLLDGQGSSMQGPLYRRLLQAGWIVELRAKGVPSVLVGGLQQKESGR